MVTLAKDHWDLKRQAALPINLKVPNGKIQGVYMYIWLVYYIIVQSFTQLVYIIRF